MEGRSGDIVDTAISIGMVETLRTVEPSECRSRRRRGRFRQTGTRSLHSGALPSALHTGSVSCGGRLSYRSPLGSVSWAFHLGADPTLRPARLAGWGWLHQQSYGPHGDALTVLKIHTVQPELKVRLAASPPTVTPGALARVEEIWQAEKARRGDALFNGPLFSIDCSSADQIIGWLAEYSWFLAQRRDPSLYPLLKVRPLGITGVLRCADGIIFGRRGRYVEMDADLWELVPSGGVDGSTVDSTGQIDLGAHLLIEMTEETGISATAVSAPPLAFAMVEDRSSRVTDIGLVLQTKLSASQVNELFAALENREYVELKVVPATRISQFLDGCGTTLAEVSRALLHEIMPYLRRTDGIEG